MLKGDCMKIWKSIYEEKPSKSGLYKVKIDDDYNHLFPIKYAHYDSSSGRWINDDGGWLPMDVTDYITYWTE